MLKKEEKKSKPGPKKKTRALTKKTSTNSGKRSCLLISYLYSSRAFQREASRAKISELFAISLIFTFEKISIGQFHLKNILLNHCAGTQTKIVMLMLRSIARYIHV